MSSSTLTHPPDVVSAAAAAGPRSAIAPLFQHGDEFLHSLGDVPMSRVVFDPWPATATEQDLVLFAERDKRLCELIDGTLVEKPIGMEESIIAASIIYVLKGFVRTPRLGVISGEAGMLRLKSSGRIRMPDIAFFSQERFDAIPLPRPKVWLIAPDLAIEVLSDSNTAAEMTQTMREFFASGTRLAWIVDPPSRTVAIYRSAAGFDQTLGGGDTIDGGDVLPGFTASIADFFEDLEPR